MHINFKLNPNKCTDIKPFAGTSGRSRADFTSKMAKRRKTIEMREKVQSQGAFSARAHERTAEIAGTSSALGVCRYFSSLKCANVVLFIRIGSCCYNENRDLANLGENPE